MPLYALTIFVSAFLLFQVQPLLGKYVLPWFGSSPSVWTTAMLFFQVVLLAGYAYAHLVSRMLSRRAQASLHVVLLAAALALLPITPAETWRLAGAENPTLRILLLLGASVGGPFVLLAASSPLLQQWAAATHPDRSPYRLYAVSNTGSLLALLSYPLLVERFLRLDTQSVVWSTGFALAAVLGALCAGFVLRRVMAGPEPEAVRAEAAEAPRGSQLLWWLALSAAGSTLLLATLNQMNQDLPPVPFLFVLPLGLYLLTFIIAFDYEPWYRRSVWCVLLHVGLTAAYVAIQWPRVLGFSVLIGLFSLALFACCMSCHGELVRRKPHPSHLTLFYLMIALGGALGGVFVSLIAPRFFDGYWEYEIGLIAAYALVMLPVARDLLAGRRPLRLLGQALVGLALVGIGAAGFALGGKIRGHDAQLEVSRSFFGTLELVRVGESSHPRRKVELYHGHVKHGFQYLRPELRTVAAGYFSPESGVGLAIEEHPARREPGRQFRLGVVGLGAGMLAAYANEASYVDEQRKTASDYLKFYEINPEVVRIAYDRFTFLRDAEARGAVVEIAVGDARTLMERELARGEPQRVDVLAVDAFTGDSVPMHLLTEECFELYRAHLAPDGILAVHASSTYLNLLPVLLAAAEAHGESAYLAFYPGDLQGGDMSTWVLIARNRELLSSSRLRKRLLPLGDVESKKVLWTDDYSSLLPLILR